MIESGAFTEDDRIELLDGWVVEKMPKKPAHSIVNGNLQDVLNPQVPTGWHIRNQEPITLSLSEPEPDLAIVRGGRNDYADGHPTAANIAVVIEVSDSTLLDDRWKSRLYAADGIPVYVLINLQDNQIELSSTPNRDDGTYADQRVLEVSDFCEFNVDGHTLAFQLDEVLPETT